MRLRIGMLHGFHSTAHPNSPRSVFPPHRVTYWGRGWIGLGEHPCTRATQPSPSGPGRSRNWCPNRHSIQTLGSTTTTPSPSVRRELGHVGIPSWGRVRGAGPCCRARAGRRQPPPVLRGFSAPDPGRGCARARPVDGCPSAWIVCGVSTVPGRAPSWASPPRAMTGHRRW